MEGSKGEEGGQDACLSPEEAKNIKYSYGFNQKSARGHI